MSQGTTIKGKTVDGLNIEVSVDAQGRLIFSPESVGGGGSGGATELEQSEQTSVLEEIRAAIQQIVHAKGISADIRVTVVGGSVAISSGTITTVGTLSNITSIGGLNATPVPQNTQNQVAIQSNINNVVIT